MSAEAFCSTSSESFSTMTNICLVAFLQLATHSRMTELLTANPIDPTLTKYTRQHLLDCVDALHVKSQLEDQTVDNYPET